MKCHMNCPVEVSVFLAVPELFQTDTREFLRDINVRQYFQTSLFEFHLKLEPARFVLTCLFEYVTVSMVTYTGLRMNT